MRSLRGDLPGFMSAEIDGTFVNLMFDGTVEHVERVTGAFVKKLVQKKGEPRGQHFFCHRLGPSEQQLK